VREDVGEDVGTDEASAPSEEESHVGGR